MSTTDDAAETAATPLANLDADELRRVDRIAKGDLSLNEVDLPLRAAVQFRRDELAAEAAADAPAIGTAEWAAGLTTETIREELRKAAALERDFTEAEAKAVDVLKAELKDRVELDNAGERADDSAGLNVTRLSATELVAVCENDTDTFEAAGEVNVPAALEELRRRAAVRDFAAGDEETYEDSRIARAFVERLEAQAQAKADDAATEEHPAEAARRYAGAVMRARGELRAYFRRKARLDALEVKETRDAKLAKLELELGEANDVLAAVMAALEEA